MKDKIEIIIVDDHAIFRDGLKSVLSQIEGFKITGEAESGKEFLDLLKNNGLPDIVLMDISMPELDGIEATKIAIKKYTNLKIIALSSYSDQVYYYKMITAGVKGFVQKKSDKYELENAIKTVHYGQSYFQNDILKNIICRINDLGVEGLDKNGISLTRREIEVLGFICNGYTNQEIAEKLYISPKTVDNHRTNLLSKTSTRNSAHLVMYAIRNKLVKV